MAKVERIRVDGNDLIFDGNDGTSYTLCQITDVTERAYEYLLKNKKRWQFLNWYAKEFLDKEILDKLTLYDLMLVNSVLIAAWEGMGQFVKN